MTTIRIVTLIPAAPKTVFDLARSAELHVRSTANTQERIVAGRSSGLFELGDEVTFEGRHFGFRQWFTAKITQMNDPHRFQDQMIR